MNKTPVSLSVRAITVSGRVASGATTLSQGLSKALNWQLINAGEIYRRYAKDNLIPLERTDLSGDDYHLKLDGFIKDKLKTEKKIIIESWLAGFNARGLKRVFKIFVTCSKDAVRVDRIVNRDNLTISLAKDHLKIREEENLKKWKRLYKSADFWNPEIYDLTIDTFKFGPTETLNQALSALGYHRSF